MEATANAAAQALDRIKPKRPSRADYPYPEVAHGRARPGGRKPGERRRGESLRGSAAGLDQRIRLQHGRAEELPFSDASFDAVSFTYLLRYVADPAATLAELGRVLRPAGGMASLDFYVPPIAVWRAGWRLYTRLLMPSAGYALGGRAWWKAGRFLGPSIEDFYRRWPRYRLYEAWREAGLVDVEERILSLGGGYVMRGRKHHA